MPKPTKVLRLAWSNLKLPTSTLPSRPLVEKRTQYLQQCTDDLYAWQTANRHANNDFVLHDGPPYANGSLHVGHALNKILKDITCRFQLIQGKKVRYVPGWDCHGLPIEIKALQAANGDGARMSALDIRAAARRLAEKAIQEQKKSFKEWAVMGDWNRAYQTMEKGFELRQLRVFKDMVEKGLIYRQYKPVYWSPSSGTALAEAELEYDENHQSYAAFVKFKIITLPLQLQPLVGSYPLYALVWTTTPWTLPANQAIAIHSDIKYSVIQLNQNGDLLLVASSRIPYVLKHAEAVENWSIWVEDIKGSELVGTTQYINILQGRGARPQPIVHAGFVSSTTGSGVVHLAPGHGMDDYDVCCQLSLPVSAPVDDQGRFTEAAFPDEPRLLQGKDVLGVGSQAVIDILKAEHNAVGETLVFSTHIYKHKYPIDWRTKLPVIVRATAQWFADVKLIKESALAAVENVQFLPPSGKARLRSFINGRNQWCISRQRAWGVPIPALYRTDTSKTEAVMTGQTVEHIIKIIEQRGIDSWWSDAEGESAWVLPALEGSYVRGKDTMDVWFDSGTSWTQLSSRAGKPPADVYVEGTDQHRGWFQSSLLTYVAHQTAKASQQSTSEDATSMAPFKTLITHGFTLDEQARKMSKSLGNVISADEIMNGTLLPPLKKQKNGVGSGGLSHDAMGPDALRLWVASGGCMQDVVISQPVLKGVNTMLLKYRVTLKWLLGVLSDYGNGCFSGIRKMLAVPRAVGNASGIGTETPELSERPYLIDRVAGQQLEDICRSVHSAYTGYEPFKAVQSLSKYIFGDLSAFYFEAAKDPLYAGTPDERLQAQQTCFAIFQSLLSMLSPVVPLLVAEVLDHASSSLRGALKDPFRTIWNVPAEAKSGCLLKRQTEWLSSAHAAIRSAQELVRAAGKLRSGLGCTVLLEIPTRTSVQNDEPLPFFQEHAAELDGIFVVSDVQVRRLDGDVSHVDGNLLDGAVGFKCTKTFTLTSSGGEVVGRATVLPPVHGKCSRCWRYKVEKAKVQQLGDTTALCDRCESLSKI